MTAAIRLGRRIGFALGESARLPQSRLVGILSPTQDCWKITGSPPGRCSGHGGRHAGLLDNGGPACLQKIYCTRRHGLRRR